MSQHTITGWILLQVFPAHWNTPSRPFFQSRTYDGQEPYLADDTVLVGEHSFEIGVPDNFNPVPQQVVHLAKAIAHVQAQAHENVRQLEEKIQNLLAIGYDKPDSVVDVEVQAHAAMMAEDAAFENDIPY